MQNFEEHLRTTASVRQKDVLDASQYLNRLKILEKEHYIQTWSFIQFIYFFLFIIYLFIYSFYFSLFIYLFISYNLEQIIKKKANQIQFSRE